MQRRVVGGACVVVWLGAATFLACSDDDDSGAPAPSAEAGATTDGDANPDAAPPATELSACIAYMKATCERGAECRKESADRLQSCIERTTNRCPEYFFAPGTNRTIEGMMACAAELRTQSCDDLRGEILLPCQQFGTLESGASCIEGPQCASGTCSESGAGSCGTCAKVYAADEACEPLSAVDSIVCPRNQVCDQKTMRCVPRKPLPEPTVGGPCGGTNGCPEDSYCGANAGEDYLCHPSPQIGESCRSYFGCRKGAYCDPYADGGTCLPEVAIGEACTPDVQCVPGGFCNGTTCVARHVQNEACNTSDSCAEGLECVGSVCKAPTPANLGERCTDACTGDARCHLVGTTSDRVCVNVANRGEACTAAHTKCAEGLDCTDAGTCQNTHYETCLADAGAR